MFLCLVLGRVRIKKGSKDIIVEISYRIFNLSKLLKLLQFYQKMFMFSIFVKAFPPLKKLPVWLANPQQIIKIKTIEICFILI